MTINKVIMNVDTIVAPNLKPNLVAKQRLESQWFHNENTSLNGFEIYFVTNLPGILRPYLVELLKDFDGLYHALIMFGGTTDDPDKKMFEDLYNIGGPVTIVYCTTLLEERYYDGFAWGAGFYFKSTK